MPEKEIVARVICKAMGYNWDNAAASLAKHVPDNHKWLIRAIKPKSLFKFNFCSEGACTESATHYLVLKTDSKSESRSRRCAQHAKANARSLGIDFPSELPALDQQTQVKVDMARTLLNSLSIGCPRCTGTQISTGIENHQCLGCGHIWEIAQ